MKSSTQSVSSLGTALAPLKHELCCARSVHAVLRRFHQSNTLWWYSQTHPDLMFGEHQDLQVRLVWTFGTPGHGKGQWDGIFGWLKRIMRDTALATTAT